MTSCCGPSNEGDLSGVPSGALLYKRDVAELLDMHHVKLVRHLEKVIERLALTYVPAVPDNAATHDILSLQTEVAPFAFKLHHDDNDGDDDDHEDGFRASVPGEHSLLSPEHSTELDSDYVPEERSRVTSTHAHTRTVAVDEIDVDFAPPKHPHTLASRSTTVQSFISSLTQAGPAVDVRETDAGREGGVSMTWANMHNERQNITTHRQKQIDMAVQRVYSSVNIFMNKSMTDSIWLFLDTLSTTINAVFVGMQLEFEVHKKTTDRQTSKVFEVGSLFFCIWFAADLLRRLCREKQYSLVGSDKAWNLFDIIIVSSMLLDAAVRRGAVDLGLQFGITWISAFRVIRLFHNQTVLSLLPFWGELKMLFGMLWTCCAELCTLFAIILLVTYLFALVLTQGAVELCFDGSLNGDACKYFGSLGASFASLYGAALGAFPWAILFNDLMTLGAHCTTAFLCFVTIVPLVFMNAVLSTVVLTHQKIEAARADISIKTEVLCQQEYIERLTEVFSKIDVDTSGAISREEFHFCFEDPHLVSLMDSMGVEVHDIDGIFDLIDVDQSNFIEMKEFVYACMRFRGNAKAADMIRLMGQVDSLKTTLEEMQNSLARSGKAQSQSREVDDVAYTRRIGSQISMKDSDTAMMFREVNIRHELMQEARHATRDHQQRIPLVEERAMTLKELLFVKRVVDLLCPDEAWQDVRSGSDLLPADVNLYHFNHHFICPVTLPNGIVLRNIVPSGEFAPGQEVIQYDDGGFVIGFGNVEEIFEDGGLRVNVLLGCFTTSSPILVAETEYTPQLELGDHISYKEFVSSKPLKTSWFCSHWWGDRIYDFVKCVEYHVQVHRLSSETSGYWVCAYANDQHNLGIDLGADVEDSSFRKAMSVANGVLLILDPSAMAFTRIWCDFEVYKAVVETKDLDVATTRNVTRKGSRPKRICCLLTGAPVPGESSYDKMRREAAFPMRILAQGIHAKLEIGSSSVVSDKEQILQNMAKDVDATITDFDERLKLALTKANATLNAYFALAAWPTAVRRRLVEDFDWQKPGTLALPAVLAKDCGRQSLTLDLSHLDMMSNKDMESLAKGFPPSLETLELRFKNCTGISDFGFTCLVNAISEQEDLSKISLSLIACPCISDRSLVALAQVLPAGLRELHLNFGYCGRISSIGVNALARNLPVYLRTFTGTFGEASLGCNFNSLQDFLNWFAGERAALGFTSSTPPEIGQQSSLTRVKSILGLHSWTSAEMGQQSSLRGIKSIFSSRPKSVR